MIVSIFVVIAGLIVTVIAAPQIKYYASRYDHLDVEAILNNRRMVNYYAACLLSKGPCPPQGLEFKQILPEALKTNCARCTEKQKTVTYRTIRRLKKEYPKIWEQLANQWDPDDIYVRKFEATFENYQPTVAPVSSTTPSTTTTTSPTTTTSSTTQVTVLGDRFGDDEDNNRPYPPPNYSTGTTSTTSSTTSSSFTTTTTTTTTARTTTKPTNNRPILLTTRPPTFGTVGGNLQATVSFGTNVVGGIVRGLGNLGTRVIETGAKLANAVISIVRQ